VLVTIVIQLKFAIIEAAATATEPVQMATTTIINRITAVHGPMINKIIIQVTIVTNNNPLTVTIIVSRTTAGGIAHHDRNNPPTKTQHPSL